jgi:hypothetical protein
MLLKVWIYGLGVLTLDGTLAQLLALEKIADNGHLSRYKGRVVEQWQKAGRMWKASIEYPLEQRMRLAKLCLRNNGTSEYLWDYDLAREAFLPLIDFPAIALHENLKYREWHDWSKQQVHAGVSIG